MSKLKELIKKHRWEFYGICSVIGLILTVLPFLHAFAPSSSPPDDTSPVVSVESNCEPEGEKLRIVEKSAGEITATSQDLPNSYYSED